MEQSKQIRAIGGRRKTITSKLDMSANFHLLRGRAAVLFIVACVSVPSAWADTGNRPLPPAFGPHTHPPQSAFQKSRSFAATDRIVGTYYFYWYDDVSKRHVTYADGGDMLTTHPPTLTGFSYKSGSSPESVGE